MNLEKKVMATKLIDADTIVHYQTYDDEYEELQNHKSTIAEFLDTMTDEGCPEAVDAVPVRHGEWRAAAYGFWQCTVCCFASEAYAADILYKFCPNCGARMDGRGNGNEID